MEVMKAGDSVLTRRERQKRALEDPETLHNLVSHFFIEASKGSHLR